MKRNSIRIFVAIVVALSVCELTQRAESQDQAVSVDLMPRAEDYTSMWWAEGFPPRVSNAPWDRCIQTGYYALVLDTESLRIPHFGPLPPGTTYSGRSSPAAWQALPPADLGLRMTVDGTAYDCTEGSKWTQFTGPRLIESGRFMQRADVTDLVFKSVSGQQLNVQARLETAAWPDRLGLILAARPGLRPITAGDACFGRLAGGFGLDGTNHLEIPHSAELDTEQLTLELWAFVPTDHRASRRTWPWLVCKNRNEHADGNFGIMIIGGKPQANINIGGGSDNHFRVDATRGHALKLNAWNHLAISYDGHALRLYVNGAASGERTIGRKRIPGRDALAIGRRQDNSGDGYHFRGAVDEIRFYNRALTPAELRARFMKPQVAKPEPVRAWSFRADGQASKTQLREQWNDAVMEIGLRNEQGVQRKRWELPERQTWSASDWQEVALTIDPVAFQAADAERGVTVQAFEIPGGTVRAVEYDAARCWHRVDLNGIEPIVPSGETTNQNDAVERIKLVLSNPTDRPQVTRLLFAKDAGGFRQRVGSAITGMSAVLRDAEGHPTGIPVQLSKNWHNRAAGGVYAGTWFHGFTQVRLPPGSTIELELTLVYGHWGGVAAASHAQLSLIGWGSNQLWDQSALGAWGESICYEPDQIQAACSITDVRPLMVASMDKGDPWGWTCNVGGGDFFRLFDSARRRVPHAAMRTAYHRQGPCLTEVTYAGRIGKAIEHAATVGLARTDDLVRGIYRMRFDVNEATEFTRFVIFQIGADTYSYTGERKMAIGDESGLIKEWSTNWGGDTYRTEPAVCAGRAAWVSLHESVPRLTDTQRGAWANRGIVIRQWKAQLGGKQASPWIAERGVSTQGANSSTLDILPPPGVTRLEPGDFVEATIEHIVMPQFAKDYYGPNEALRAALTKSENTWRMIHREAAQNDRKVNLTGGTVEHLYPDVRVRAQEDGVKFTITGGLGYVPVTFTNLTSHRGYRLKMDGQPIDQSVHGNDFWQTDYNHADRRWSQTYNIPIMDGQPHTIQFAR